MHTFSAPPELIRVNPFVRLPAAVLTAILDQAGRSKGLIRVMGTINGRPYQQTLLRYAGRWRLYISLTMLLNSLRRIGDMLAVTVAVNTVALVALACPALKQALSETPEVRRVFDGLPPSHQLEIVRYLTQLKTEASLTPNIDRALGFLLGKSRFVGRGRP